MFKLIWLPAILRAAGLAVVEVPGWQTRGHGDSGEIKGILCHHTATRNPGHLNYPSLGVVRDGRRDLAGPLCHLGLALDGTFYVVAAGRPYHAGPGSWQGIINGNSQLISIEAENDGTPNDPWPSVQMECYARGCAAVLDYIGAKPIMCAGHKEYAPRRKPDPSFDMNAFRVRVEHYMKDSHEIVSVPAPGDKDVRWLQRVLNQFGTAVPPLSIDGKLGAKTRTALITYQHHRGLDETGVQDAATMTALTNDLGHHEGCNC